MSLYICQSNSGAVMGIFDYPIRGTNITVTRLPDPNETYQKEKYIVLGYYPADEKKYYEYQSKKIVEAGGENFFLITDIRECLLIKCGKKLVKLNTLYPLEEGLLCHEEEWDASLDDLEYPHVPQSIQKSYKVMSENPLEFMTWVRTVREFQFCKVILSKYLSQDSLHLVQEYSVSFLTEMEGQTKKDLSTYAMQHPPHNTTSSCIVL